MCSWTMTGSESIFSRSILIYNIDIVWKINTNNGRGFEGKLTKTKYPNLEMQWIQKKYIEKLAENQQDELHDYENIGIYAQKVTGVLRSLNRVVKRNGLQEVCCHGWEDVSLLVFVAEVIGIISHLFRRTDEITLNVERSMHGINKPIKAATKKIKQKEKRKQ